MLGPSDGTFAVTSGFIPLANLQRQISKDPTNSATADYTETLWTPSGVDLLLIGTGEYMTGYTDSSLPHSKSCVGVVALTMFDLRRRNKINRLGLCGKDGRSFPHIRLHLQKTISDVYSGLSTEVETFPADDETKQFAYADALLRYGADDAVIVHSSYGSSQYQIALDAIEKKMHVLLMLPTSQTLEQQIVLLNAARRNNVLVVFECCYRFDAMCIDARDRIHKLGSFSYMYSHITQPKFSKSMDCEVSLGDGNDCILFPNSNYVDFHTWVSGNSSRPISVTACASNSISTQSCNLECEESVTLMVQWENLDKSKGTAVHTSTWIAPCRDSKQHFFYMCGAGEVNVDQQQSGYSTAEKETGFQNINPLFTKLTPTNGKFSGRNTSVYRSFESFIDAVSDIKSKKKAPNEFESSLATLATTMKTTAILHAGRLSLNIKRPVTILYDDLTNCHSPTSLEIFE